MLNVIKLQPILTNGKLKMKLFCGDISNVILPLQTSANWYKTTILTRSAKGASVQQMKIVAVKIEGRKSALALIMVALKLFVRGAVRVRFPVA